MSGAPAAASRSPKNRSAALGPSGAIRTSRSRRKRSGTRLVARITVSGEAVSSSVRWGPQAVTRFRLSSTSRADIPARCSASPVQVSAAQATAWATVARASSDSVTSVRSAKYTAPGRSAAIASAATRATVVLPTPPGPVSVTRRPGAVPRTATISATSSSRPTTSTLGGDGVRGVSLRDGISSATSPARPRADSSAMRSASRSCSAVASARTVCGWGRVRRPRSSALTASTDTLAAVASSRWVSDLASLKSRRSAAKLIAFCAGPAESFTMSIMPAGSGRLSGRCPGSVRLSGGTSDTHDRHDRTNHR